MRLGTAVAWGAGALVVVGGAIGGMSARLATCKKDPIPENAKAMVQGDTFTLAPCPIFLMDDDSVRGGFFRSPHILNKLGEINPEGPFGSENDSYVTNLVGGPRAMANSHGDVYQVAARRGGFGFLPVKAGQVEKNGRVKNIVGDHIATIYNLEDTDKETNETVKAGNKIKIKKAGVGNDAQKNGLGAFALGV